MIMYVNRRIQLFYNLTCSLAVIFFLIGLSHGFEVHTPDEVQAEYRGSITLSCWYTPASSTSSDFRLLWANENRVTFAYIYGGGTPVETAERYDLAVDYRSGNLTINDIQLDDEGRYTCEVTPGSFAKQSYVNLIVVAEPDELVLSSRTGSTPLAIQQGTVTLKPGLETTFVCEAVGSRPAVAIEWYIDGVPHQGTVEETQTPNSQDDRLQDTTSSLVIADPGQFRQGQSLTCIAIREGKMVRNTSIVISVEKPPGNSVAIIGLDDRITSSTKQTPSCIAQDSLPASQITWTLGGESVTDNAESTTEEMTSGMMRVSSALEYIPSWEDDGKILQCRVSHVALGEDIVAEKAICLSDSEMRVTVEQEHPFFLFLRLSGIPHSASCTVRACYVDRGSSLQRSCIPRDLGDMYSDTLEHEYEFRDLVSSPSYKIVLNLTCHHSCGDRTATTDTDVDTISTTSISPVDILDSESMTSSTGNVWIRDLIFVIIAVIVVSAFVIVVTVSVVLRAVVKGSIRAARAEVENHVTTSPDRATDTPRSSILSSWSNNLYTIEEGNEGESKIYHEIKESRTSLVEPSDILVSTLPNSQQRYTARLSMRHPRPPPLPPPINRLSLDPAVLAAATDSSDTESDRDEYVPMSPDTYSIDSDYMAMNSANKN